MVRVADALDMAQGRTRIPIESGHEGIHSISAAAIDEVRIRPARTIRCRSRSSSTTRRASSRSTTCWRRRSAAPRWRKVEVVAEIEGETEKRLLSGFRLS